MSKRILVSVACIALALPLGHTFSGRLLADEATYTPLPTGFAVPDHPTPEGIVIDYSSGRVPTPAEIRDAASGWSPQPLHQAPPVKSTFTVVSDGKRSILLNETTGASWQLTIDNPGSHWEPIAMGVSKGGKTEISWSAAPAGTANVQPAAPSDNREAISLEQSEKHLRRLSYALDSETERSGDLEKSLTEANLKILRLTDGVFKYRDEVAELKKELREAKKALTARPELAPAQPKSTSEDANPFE